MILNIQPGLQLSGSESLLCVRMTNTWIQTNICHLEILNLIYADAVQLILNFFFFFFERIQQYFNWVDLESSQMHTKLVHQIKPEYIELKLEIVMWRKIWRKKLPKVDTGCAFLVNKQCNRQALLNYKSLHFTNILMKYTQCFMKNHV